MHYLNSHSSRHIYFNDKGELKGMKRLHDTTMTAEQATELYGANGPGEANMANKKLTHFNSQTGKVNLQKHPWSLFSDFWTWLKPKEDELWFSNGRINEIWQRRRRTPPLYYPTLARKLCRNTSRRCQETWD